MNKHNKNKSSLHEKQPPQPQYEAIYLGVDLHKASISVTRIIDHSTPQPAQRFNWEQFIAFAQKQVSLAKKVYAVYEAGAFGFWPARQLKEMGVAAFVVHPEKLDPYHKRVQTDKLDSRHLADKLQRYVLGNQKAMVAVYVPTPQEEQARLEGRHRRKLQQQLKALQARGRGLLLGQGIFDTQAWWKPNKWQSLSEKLSPQLRAILEDNCTLLLALEKLLQQTEKKLEATAPKELPRGMGKLTFALLLRELCNYRRFGNRRNIGSFTGLCGGVSSSGPSHLDLSITKAGNPEIRTLLIELAWRMVYWQPQYTGLRVWNRFCRDAGPVSARRRKIALVALARQLGVDLWRWQTGQVTAQQLGWEMLQT